MIAFFNGRLRASIGPRCASLTLLFGRRVAKSQKVEIATFRRRQNMSGIESRISARWGLGQRRSSGRPVREFLGGHEEVDLALALAEANEVACLDESERSADCRLRASRGEQRFHRRCRSCVRRKYAPCLARPGVQAFLELEDIPPPACLRRCGGRRSEAQGYRPRRHRGPVRQYEPPDPRATRTQPLAPGARAAVAWPRRA